jgi:hypothetical protein
MLVLHLLGEMIEREMSTASATAEIPVITVRASAGSSGRSRRPAGVEALN